MKIILKNFKCYSHKIFEFSDDIITLVSGPSGVGKSSICSAVLFVLFGVGNKLATHGHKNCSVELWYKDIHIIRQKCPNRLLVNDIHEDAIGQEIILKYFGDVFNTVGYLSQDSTKSFIAMSPTEKLDFIEQFAFNGINLTDIKTKSKSHSKTLNDNLISVQAQLEMARSVLKKIPDVTHITAPKGYTEKIPSSLVKTQSLLSQCSRDINDLHVKITEVTSRESLRHRCEEDIHRILERMSETRDMIETLKTQYIGDDKLDMYEKDLKTLVRLRDYMVLKEKYESDVNRLEQMKQSEAIDISTEIKTLEKSLWAEYTLDEIDENITELTLCLSDIRTLKSLYEEQKKYTVKNPMTFEMYEETIKTLEDKHNTLTIMKLSLVCPNCHASVYLKDGTLMPFNCERLDNDKSLSQISEEITHMKKCLQMHRMYININNKINTITSGYENISPDDYNDVNTDLQKLVQYKTSQKATETRIKTLKDRLNGNILSQSLVKFQQDINTQYSQILKMEETISNCNNYIMNETDVRDIIQIQKPIKAKIMSLEKTLSDYMIEQQRINMELLSLVSKEAVDDLRTILSQRQEDLKKYETNIEKYTKLIEHQKKYETYCTEIQNKNIWINKEKSLKDEETIILKKYTASLKLKEKILEAESIAVTNLISSINTHARIFLDDFFPDNPIAVELLPFKESKKTTKPQINISVIYKDVDCGIETLSSGEYARVSLAYTLALNEMFNTPIIMLDECTSNLDHILTNTVIESIQSHFKGKTVFIIAHQAEIGMYENVLLLS